MADDEDVAKWATHEGRAQVLEGILSFMRDTTESSTPLSAARLLEIARESTELTPRVRTLVRAFKFSKTFLNALLVSKARLSLVYELCPPAIVATVVQSRTSEWRQARAAMLAFECRAYATACRVAHAPTSQSAVHLLARTAGANIEREFVAYIAENLYTPCLMMSFECVLYSCPPHNVMCVGLALVARACKEADGFYERVLTTMARSDTTGTHTRILCMYALLFDAPDLVKRLHDASEGRVSIVHRTATWPCHGCVAQFVPRVRAKIDEYPETFWTSVETLNLEKVVVAVHATMAPSQSFIAARAAVGGDVGYLATKVVVSYVRTSDRAALVADLLRDDDRDAVLAALKYADRANVECMAHFIASAAYVALVFERRDVVKATRLDALLERHADARHRIAGERRMWSTENALVVMKYTSVTANELFQEFVPRDVYGALQWLHDKVPDARALCEKWSTTERGRLLTALFANPPHQTQIARMPLYMGFRLTPTDFGCLVRKGTRAMAWSRPRVSALTSFLLDYCVDKSIVSIGFDDLVALFARTHAHFDAMLTRVTLPPLTTVDDSIRFFTAVFATATRHPRATERVVAHYGLTTMNTTT